MAWQEGTAKNYPNKPINADKIHTEPRHPAKPAPKPVLYGYIISVDSVFAE